MPASMLDVRNWANSAAFDTSFCFYTRAAMACRPAVYRWGGPCSEQYLSIRLFWVNPPFTSWPPPSSCVVVLGQPKANGKSNKNLLDFIADWLTDKQRGIQPIWVSLSLSLGYPIFHTQTQFECVCVSPFIHFSLSRSDARVATARTRRRSFAPSVCVCGSAAARRRTLNPMHASQVHRDEQRRNE